MIALLILFALGSTLVVTESHTHLFHRVMDNLVYDNYHHYLPCEKLPTLQEAKRALQDNRATVDRIVALDPKTVTVELDSLTCPDRGSIKIYYPSTAIRKEIESILGEKSFFGIPLDLISY